MYNSISYVEISCKYNRSELCRFCGALQNASANRKILFRGRVYFIAYDADRELFFIRNRNSIDIAKIGDNVFHYYVSSAPEIGLDLIFALMAVLSVFPVKAF
ncbi:MAG: hypothetical protein IJV81_03505 [Paludibacteraceae bacterium]|nr:hypothetical protein [Paludibacteraceae bacterium]